MENDEAAIWCLLGLNSDANRRLAALTRALDRPHSDKLIKPHAWELLLHLGHGATLAGIDQARSSPLRAPWPALVVTAERCTEPVALWIKRQAGNATHLVHLGRPWTPIQHWDLIATSAEYTLPARRNILRLSLPLEAQVSAPDKESVERFSHGLGNLPRPWIALLAGANRGPNVFSTGKGAVLGDLADRLAAATGGSLLYCDSPQTPWATGEAIVAQLNGDNFIHHCDDSPGPYREILACADAAVVAGDSPDFTGEAAVGGKPLFLFDTGDGHTAWWKLAHNYRPGSLGRRLVTSACPRRLQVDSGALQRRLVARGRALPFEERTLPVIMHRIVDSDGSDSRGRVTGDLSALGRSLENLFTAANENALPR